MNTSIEKKIKFLQLYAIVSTLGFCTFLLTGFTKNMHKSRFEEIDVERINIIEKSGKVRLVIANNERSPGQVMDGKIFGKTGGRPGFIFYNNEGDECGGLGIAGEKKEGKINAFGGLMFDQYKQDQVIALQYSHEAGQKKAGLTVLDRPDVPLSYVIERQNAIAKMLQGPTRDSAIRELVAYQGGVAYGAPRIFIGREVSKEAIVKLCDKFGKPRLQLLVDSTGKASILFLDEGGKITYSFPPME